MTNARHIQVTSVDEIPQSYRGTPIELLLKYQNLGMPYDKYTQAQILIGMCIDYRKHLGIPENFAYIIRSGGANLRFSEFKVSFAIAVGGVSAIALIGHTQCGMVNLQSKKDAFIEGLVERAGWDRQEAEMHFNQSAPVYGLTDETDFVLNEAKRLQSKYPKILVVPMIYRVEDGFLYLVQEK